MYLQGIGLQDGVTACASHNSLGRLFGTAGGNCEAQAERAVPRQNFFHSLGNLRPFKQIQSDPFR